MRAGAGLHVGGGPGPRAGGYGSESARGLAQLAEVLAGRRFAVVDGRAADEDVARRPRRRRATLFGLDAAVQLDVRREAALVEHRAQAAHLVEHRRDELLAAPAGVDHHHHHLVGDVEHVFDGAERRAGLMQMPARLRMAWMPRSRRSACVRRLDVEVDDVAAGLGERLELALRVARSSGGCRAGASSRLRTASTTSGPKVIGGTKWPSITSRWM